MISSQQTPRVPNFPADIVRRTKFAAAASAGRTSEIGGRKPAARPRTARDLAADWGRWSLAERIVAVGIMAFWMAAMSSLVVLNGL